MKTTNTVWAIALAAVLAMAAMPSWSIAAWADDDGSEDRKENKGKKVSEEKKARKSGEITGLAGSGNSTSLKGFKLMAKGLAVEKTEGNLKASDASIALVGTIKKGSGDQARATITGTVDIGSDQFNVRGEGKINLKKGDFGKLNIEGKISKGGGDQKFQLKALVLQTQNGSAYKVVGEKPADAGRHVRIYALLGEMEVDKSAPAPVPAVASVVVTPAMANVTGNGNVTFTASATDTNGNAITGATFVWSLSNAAAGSLAPSASTTSAVFTGANVTASSQVRATLTYGGATVTGSATVNVSPAP